MEHIGQNLKFINERIAEAADKRGKTRDDITLVGVTKTQTPDMINYMIDCGVTHIGENRVQELTEKHPLIKPCKIHMIGNLQKNKIKYIIGKVSLIQSVDTVSLAEAVNTAAYKNKLTADILLEINIAGELSKHGCLPERAFDTAKEILHFDNIRLLGIMTVAPIAENQEKNRLYFKKMFEIYVDIREKICNNSVRILSMGMTGDYIAAIEEGATMVRIGTGIFNGRNNTLL